ncbi:kinase-like domain-containing protein [Dichotomocladium elegans]|nr:kinase-like domain-containing protein [Dichotomocladium elegans]
MAFQRTHMGLLSAVYFMSSPNQSRVLLRVYGVGVDQIVDRQHELAWLARLSSISNNVSPQLLATFGNGRFEEYFDSTTLRHDDMRDPVVSCQIAQALRQLHNVTTDFPPSDPCRIEVWRNVSLWYTAVREMLNNPVWKEKLTDLGLEGLSAEIERCKTILENRPTTIVFAHNDTQYGNVLRLADTQELVIVDFEYAGYNPRAYDIANHFCEWMYDYHSNDPAAMRVQAFPNREERMRFLNAYIGNEPIEMTAEELDRSALEWTMASHIQWALWGIIQYSQSEIDFDYYKYFEQRLNAFRDQLAKC